MSVPVINAEGTLPASLRDAAPAKKQAYATALSFEQMLVGELSKTLTATSTDDGSGDDAAQNAQSAYAPLLSQALSESIAQGGGLGLAPALARSFERQAGGSR